MLAKSFRFHGHRSLQHALRRGQTHRGEYFSVKTLAAPNREKTRVAVVVSKKVSKSAVQRNRIRRRLYENIRTGLKTTGTPQDIIVIVHSEKVAELPAATLRAELGRTLGASISH